MFLKRIGAVLVALMGFNAFLDSFFSFERGNFTVRLVPYAFKFLQLFLMLAVILYFLAQRSIRIKINPLFWLLFLLIGDIAVSLVYAQYTVNPSDLPHM